MPEKEKDWWDIASIVSGIVSGLLIPISVAAVGFFSTQYLDRRQMEESNNRFYTELMSRREEADSSLRKDMFISILESLFQSKPTNPKEKVLNLELLALNFHESLDLRPLFEMVAEQIRKAPRQQMEVLTERLEEVAQKVKDKQVSALEEVGWRSDGTIVFEELREKPEGIDVLDNSEEETPEQPEKGPGKPAAKNEQVSVEALSVDPERKRVRVRLTVGEGVDIVFWVGLFNFPMSDNIRLPGGQRCAVILNAIDDENADITFVRFPGERASVKDKPYYDEVINQLKKAREQNK